MRDFALVAEFNPFRCLTWRLPRQHHPVPGLESHCLGLDSFDGVNDLPLRQAVEALGLTPRLTTLFIPTSPLWYGFWVQSPLSRAQADCLSQLLRTAELSFDSSHDKAEFPHLLEALGLAAVGQIVLEVEISKPTASRYDSQVTRPHCPRCRAATEIDPWSEMQTWPSPVDCPVCGFAYDPRITYSPIVDGFEGTIDQIVCTDCDASWFYEDFDESQHEKLWNLIDYDRVQQALTITQRWHEFFLDYPDWETRWLPHVMEGLRIDAPEQLAEIDDEKCWSNLPADIELPAPDMTEADYQCLRQLRQHFETTPDKLHDAVIEYERCRELAESSGMICPECDGDLRGLTGLPRCSKLKQRPRA